MDYTADQATQILGILKNEFESPTIPQNKVKKLWYMMAGIRARALANSVSHVTGNKVVGGPFKDMLLTATAIAHYNGSNLLGCYESELHPILEHFITQPYKNILNIGCSVGYYAVGMSLRMPHAEIYAFDIDEEARKVCTEAALLNGVQDRVHVSGLFQGEDFGTFVDQKTLAIVDIEGAERYLLTPELYPALKNIDLVVEMHEFMDRQIITLLTERFSETHTMQLIPNQTHFPDLKEILPKGQYIDPFDHFLLAWEGRDGPTPWGIFTVK